MSLLKKILLTVFLVLILTTPSTLWAENFTVAVAANMQFAFDELKTVFETDKGIPVRGIMASSGKLSAQIANGAPFDVFLSANVYYPETLFKQGWAYQKPKIYAYGTLVLWTIGDLDLSRGIHTLTDPLVQKIAVANPQTAPYGRETINALNYYGLYGQIDKKLVYGESIAQTNLFISSGASDAGFTAKSVVLAPHMKNVGRWIEVNAEAYEPIAQTAVILKHAKEDNLVTAQQFYDFLFSKQAQDIFQQYGYILP